MVVLVAVTAVPLGRMLYESLFNDPYTNPGARRFVGFANYRNVLGNAGWWEAVAWSLAVVVLVVVVQLAIGFGFAGVLYRARALAPVVRILLILPFAAMAFLTAFSFTAALDGGYLAEWFRLDAFGENGATAALVLAEIWRGAGVVALILLVGMLRVGPGLMRAAVADGANLTQRFTRVVLPATAPAVAIAIVYRALDSVRMFDSPYVGHGAAPGVNPPQTWIHTTTLSRFELGLGATMAVVFVLLCALVGIVLVRALRVGRAV